MRQIATGAGHALFRLLGTRARVGRSRLRKRATLAGVAGFALLFAAAALLRLFPDYLDRPLQVLVWEMGAGNAHAVNFAMVVTYPAVEGVGLTALIWYCWFATDRTDEQARLLRCVTAAVLAGVAANLFHGLLPSVPKPMYDPEVHAHMPLVLQQALGNDAPMGASSFPSERGALFAGVAAAVWRSRRAAGLTALALFAFVEACRVFLGLHYPTDIAGSFSLGAALVWLADGRLFPRLGTGLIRWGTASAPVFYMGAFVASYCVATAFEDVRALAALILS
jgi:membrane-associated phospholipid phosphatase